MYTPWLRHPGYLTSNDDKYFPWVRMGFQWLRLLNTFRYAVKQCTECVNTIGERKMLTSDEDLAEVQRPRVWKIGSSCFRLVWPNSNLRKLWHLTGAIQYWLDDLKEDDTRTPILPQYSCPHFREDDSKISCQSPKTHQVGLQSWGLDSVGPLEWLPVFSIESRFCLSSNDGRVNVWR